MNIFRSCIAIVFISIVVYYIYQSIIDDKAFKKAGIVTNAMVIKAGSDYKGRLQLDYFYCVDSIKINARAVVPELTLSSETKLIGKWVPVMYLKNIHEKNVLLLSRKSFEIVGLSFPDSLLWIEKFEKR